MNEIKKNILMFFFKFDIFFIIFIIYLKCDQKNICMYIKKWIVNFMNNVYKKLKCIKGLLIL